jgi:hypothetical protein
MAVMQPIRAPKKQKQEAKCKNGKDMTVRGAKNGERIEPGIMHLL